MVKEQSGLFFAEPTGLSSEEIIKKTEDFGRKTVFIYGDLVVDHIAEIKGHVLYDGRGMWNRTTHFRNFADFDNEPLSPGYKFHIYIVEKASTYEMNYLAAHLLGHYVLHCPEGRKIFVPYDNEIMTYRLPGYGWDRVVEWEASLFAATLLMPEKDFMQEWEQINTKSLFNIMSNHQKKLKAMSDIFKVPEDFIRTRLKNLEEKNG